MNTTTRTLGMILAILCLRPAGLNAAAPEWQQVEAALRARGVPAESAAATARVFEACERDALPVDPLRTRLQEGLAKGAAPDAIHAALLARLTALKRARDMVRAAGYDETAETSHRDLMHGTALALESGLDADDVAGVLRRGGGESALRVQTAIESGESLHLAGVDRATVRDLMFDCLDRNLRRMEMLRATRFTIQQHRTGMTGSVIRQRLWGNDASSPPHGNQVPGGNGAGRGGPGGGPMGPPSRDEWRTITPSAAGNGDRTHTGGSTSGTSGAGIQGARPTTTGSGTSQGSGPAGAGPTGNGISGSGAPGAGSSNAGGAPAASGTPGGASGSPTAGSSGPKRDSGGARQNSSK